VRLFNLADAARPALLAPGDTLRFAPVSRDEFECLAADVAAGKIGPKDWQEA
jgi:allophanate hydrolase subunit 1